MHSMAEGTHRVPNEFQVTQLCKRSKLLTKAQLLGCLIPVRLDQANTAKRFLRQTRRQRSLVAFTSCHLPCEHSIPAPQLNHGNWYMLCACSRAGIDAYNSLIGGQACHAHGQSGARQTGRRVRTHCSGRLTAGSGCANAWRYQCKRA